MQYAILNSEGQCINRVLWDGETDWQPPDGCTAIADPDSQHPIFSESQQEPDADPLAALTSEQKEVLLALLSNQ
jgi:hypothetical protein